MQHRIPHDLSDEMAKRAVSAALDSYTQRFAKYNVVGQWASDDRATVRFSAKGLTLEGALRLAPGAIVFEMDVPLLLRAFKGRATAKVEEHVQRWIMRAKDGNL